MTKNLPLPGSMPSDLEGIIKNTIKQNPHLKNLKPEQVKEIVSVMSVQLSHCSYSGPLPDPNSFAAYEQALPGAGNRIITMAEENSKDRRTINDKLVNADIKRSKNGQILGFILSILFIGAAVFCAYMKQPWPASVLGVGGFSSIISIFVLGKK